MPPYEIVGADEPYYLDADRDVAMVATFLLDRGQYELRDGGATVLPAGTDLSTLHHQHGINANAILKQRRADLLAALSNVRPESGHVAQAARRLARVLQQVKYA